MAADGPIGLLELFLRPVPGHDQLPADLLRIGIAGGQFAEQAGSHLAEEGADDHVELLHEGPFLPEVQHLVDDQGDQQDLDEDEGDVADEIEEDMVGVPEDHVVDQVECGRQNDQQDAQPDLPE